MFGVVPASSSPRVALLALASLVGGMTFWLFVLAPEAPTSATLTGPVFVIVVAAVVLLVLAGVRVGKG
ncbi:hypothetical protein SAMN04487948_106150 [Halogranum amylolyticum]|uniref:Uncharacterized protein n=1 Tax=Halogranum amylolyticum TaxID=660520 RepID=A0A1H8TB90_9EURY|nr:hypothetical protein [Halogranum amylolyticum]SEO88207.1 hypothetical protein SAMN04487948_106150 [Halogranum amylolyticum]